MTEYKWQMFMAHIKHKNLDDVVEKLLSPQYAVKQYLITAETAGYEHLHFMVYMTDKAYHAFSKSCFKDQFKLKGKAALKTDKDAGRPRQYGKENIVKDKDKAMSYCLKDKGLYKTNMDEAYIKVRIEASFQKVEKRALLDECMEYLEKLRNTGKLKEIKTTPILDGFVETVSPKELIYRAIIKFLVEKDRTINKSIVNSYYLNYLRTSEYYSLEEKTSNIYNHLFRYNS